MSKKELLSLHNEIHALQTAFYEKLKELIAETGAGKPVPLMDEPEIFFDNYLGKSMPVRAVKVFEGKLAVESLSSDGEWLWHEHDSDGSTDLVELLIALP